MKRFDTKTPVADSVRRIAVDQVGTALAAVDDATISRPDAIHKLRQTIKKLRALLRIVRKSFPDYRRENLYLRDTGRLLSSQRDADVLRGIYDAVVTRAGLNPDHELRERLASSVEGARVSRSPAELLDEAACRLMEFRRRVPGWSFEGQGFALIAGGLDRVYRDMREAEKRAAREPGAANFHEWRKQVKHHAAHIILLRDTAPDILKAYGKVAKELADILGEHHDLDVLLSRLAIDAESPRGEREALSDATTIRHRQLEKEAFRLGEELAAEKPSDFLDRMAHSWKAWRE